MEACETAHELTQRGATADEVARALGISLDTLNAWRYARPEFSAAFKLGRDAADERVEASLYARAVGYRRTAFKVMQNDGQPILVTYDENVPPDVAAAFIWLKNRRPHEWRDRHEHISVKVNAVRSMSSAEILQHIERLEAERKALPAPHAVQESNHDAPSEE
jgi:hypothetical protein